MRWNFTTLCLSAFLTILPLSYADVYNGDFELPLDSVGLNGEHWEYNTGVIYDEFFGMDFPSGTAILYPSGIASSMLSQEFSIEAGSTALNFSYFAPTAGNGETDYFYATLLDSANTAVYSYVWNSSTAEQPLQSGITSSGQADDWRTVTMDLNGLDFIDPYTLRFELVHDYGDDIESEIRVDNVELAAAVVPGPSALLLASIGSLAAVYLRKK